MKFKMPRLNGEYSFTIKGADIASTCARVLELTKEASATGSIVNHLVGVAGNKSFVLGYSPEATVIEYLGLGNGDGFSVIDLEAVRDISKKKAEVEIRTEGEVLILKSGRSTTKLPVATPQPDTVAYIDNLLISTAVDASPLPSQILGCLNDGTKTVEIKDVFKLEKTLVTHLISQKGKPIQVLSYDQFHSVIYTADVKADRDFRLAMPTKLFQIVSKFSAKSKDGDTRFFVDSSGLRVESDEYVMILPPIQTNDNEVNQVLVFEETFRTWAAFPIKEELLESIKSSLSLASDGAGSVFEMQIMASKKRMRTKLTAARGETEDRYPLHSSAKVTEDITVKIDPRILSDIVRKVKGNTTVKLCGFAEEPSMILLKNKDGTTVSCWGSLL